MHRGGNLCKVDTDKFGCDGPVARSCTFWCLPLSSLARQAEFSHPGLTSGRDDCSWFRAPKALTSGLGASILEVEA